MNVTLKQTTASKVASAIINERRQIGFSTMGMVMTLVVVCEPRDYESAVDAALTSSREHPSRIIAVVSTTAKNSGLDAEVRLGEGVPGELIVLRMRGDVAQHPTSVVLPLLLPDSPVVVWWPGESPVSPGEDPIGRLGTRRITDALGSRNPLKALEIRAENHMRGDTDLTWTRLTPWRALLAAAVDQFPAKIHAATVEGARNNAPATLLAAWLECRLGVEVTRVNTRGPGITAVRLSTAAGDIAVTRGDGLLANYVVPGEPQRTVALRRRDIDILLTEELRRMDYDDIFEQAAQMLTRRALRGPDGTSADDSKRVPKKPTAKKTGAKKTTAKKATAKKTTAKTGTRKASTTQKTTTKRTAKTTPAQKTASTSAQVAAATPAPSAAELERREAQAAVPISPEQAGLTKE